MVGKITMAPGTEVVASSQMLAIPSKRRKGLKNKALENTSPSGMAAKFVQVKEKNRGGKQASV